MAVKNKRILSIERQDLLKEWDFEKNFLICSPDKITIGSSKKVWWKCSKCGREWMSIIGDRAIKNKGCSVCSNIEGSKKRKSRILKRNGSLLSNNPRLIQEWDFEKNDIRPEEITSSSDKKVWWKCFKGHSYQMRIANRTNGKQGCPYCSSKKILVGYNDLETTHPEVAKQWDYEKNYPLTPKDILHASLKKFFWICPECKESYVATANSRTRKKYYCLCSSCSKRKGAALKNKKVTNAGYNLASANSQLAKEWHPSKNPIKPNEVTPGSTYKAWWICKICGREFKQSVTNRSIQNQGCPYCAKACQTSEPEQIIFYYVKKHFNDAINGYKAKWLGKSEIDIFIPSAKIAIEYDGANWHKDVNRDITKGKLLENNDIRLIRIREGGLPTINDGSYVITTKDYYQKASYLNKPIIELMIYLNEKTNNSHIIDVDVERDYQSILEKFAQKRKEKSFGSVRSDLVKEWHPTKNKGITPYNVSASSHKKIWWKCSNCNFEWQAEPASRYSLKRGTGCPECGKQRVHHHLKQRGLVLGKTDLKTLRPDLANEWNYEKNQTKPENYAVNSNKSIWWKCLKGHEWEAKISSRTRKKQTNCPYCSGSKILAGFNDLVTTHPQLSEEWDYEKNHSLVPSNISKGSNKKVWWKCKECGLSYQATTNHRIRKRKDGTFSGCPNCKNIRTSIRMSKKQHSI